MPIYQVSYVVIGGKHPGAILVQNERPAVGQIVTLGRHPFQIVEVVELLPATGGVIFLHATCRPVDGHASLPHREDKAPSDK